MRGARTYDRIRFVQHGALSSTKTRTFLQPSSAQNFAGEARGTGRRRYLYLQTVFEVRIVTNERILNETLECAY